MGAGAGIGEAMTVLDEPQVDEQPEPQPARGLLAFFTTTDHKRIGIAYMVTAQGRSVRVQLWPAQASANTKRVSVDIVPVARHDVADGHDTPVSDAL
jgi:hypothetical protein